MEQRPFDELYAERRRGGQRSAQFLDTAGGNGLGTERGNQHSLRLPLSGDIAGEFADVRGLSAWG
ncbi:hypothetical protein D3C76_1825080 [compost metagenome]